jgi:hypothetical protein
MPVRIHGDSEVATAGQRIRRCFREAVGDGFNGSAQETAGQA